MKQVVTVRQTAFGSVNHALSKFEAQHQALEARLMELGRRSYLTPNEQREVVEIKKFKLKAKDRIAALRES